MPIILIHNAQTGEIIEREMTEKELDQFQEDQKSVKLEKEKKQALIDAKNELLNKLGITEDEAKLLLS